MAEMHLLSLWAFEISHHQRHVPAAARDCRYIRHVSGGRDISTLGMGVISCAVAISEH